jgi:alkaline phosphatase D
MAKVISRRRFTKLTVVSVTGLAAGCSSERESATTFEPVSVSDTTVEEADASLVDVQQDTGPLDTVADTVSYDADSASGPDGADAEPPEPPPSFDAGDFQEDMALFPLAVQAGGAESDGALLWTVYEGDLPLDIVVFSAGDGTAGDLMVSATVEVADGGTVHVIVEGLKPWTAYRYCFVERDGDDSVRSAVGRFRTAPEADAAEVITFGGTSCVNDYYSPHKTLSRASEAGLDFFILAGDTVYADGSSDLEEYRSVWRNALADPGYRDLLTSTSVVATWDDHEITNDWDPEFIDPGLLAAGTEAFFEHVTLRRIEESPDRIWRSHRWGSTLEVFMLDSRSERLPSTRKTPIAQYLSDGQMAWLKAGLVDSPCTFKLIVNSVPITNFPDVIVSENDRWEGYPVQRDEILGYIHEADLTGVIWLAGDFHFGAMTRVEPPPHAWSTQREVLMGPGDQFINPGWLTLGLAGGASQFSAAIGEVNYARFTADPTSAPPTLTVEFISADGEVLHEEAIAIDAS